MVRVSCQYHYLFWSYDNLIFEGFNQKSANRKDPPLNFVQNLELGSDTKFGIGVCNELLINTAIC